MLEKILHPESAAEIRSAQLFAKKDLGFKLEKSSRESEPGASGKGLPDVDPHSANYKYDRIVGNESDGSEHDREKYITPEAHRWTDPTEVPKTADLDRKSARTLLRRHRALVCKVEAFNRKLAHLKGKLALDPHNEILLSYKDEFEKMKSKFVDHPLYSEQNVLNLVKDVKDRTTMDKVQDRTVRLGSKTLNYLYENRVMGGTAVAAATAVKIGIFMMLVKHLAHAGQQVTGTLPPGEGPEAANALPQSLHRKGVTWTMSPNSQANGGPPNGYQQLPAAPQQQGPSLMGTIMHSNPPANAAGAYQPYPAPGASYGMG